MDNQLQATVYAKPTTQMVLRPLTEEFGLTNEQLALVKSQIAVGSTDDELRYFLTVAKKSGLDAFTKQIYAIKRKVWNKDKQSYDEKISIQTGIDGYRAIAARTNELAGIDDATYDTEEADRPNKASVTVYRKVQGERVPFSASARWGEYAQTFFNKKSGANEISGLWAKMPYLMLAKCAEALALRKAFPNELSGVYTAEEMAQAENTVKPAEIEKAKLPVKLNNAIHATWKELADLNGWDETNSDGIRHKTLMKYYGVETNNDLTEDQAKDFLTRTTEAIKKFQEAPTTTEKKPEPVKDEPKDGTPTLTLCPVCGQGYEDDGKETGDVGTINFVGMCNKCIGASKE